MSGRRICGLSDDEARDVVYLAGLPQWQSFEVYLDELISLASDALSKLGLSQEKAGYYRGIIQIVKDQKRFPGQVSRMLDGRTPSDDGGVWLD